MDFIKQPEDAKKFGTVKWFKWHLFKYPHVFLIAVPFTAACLKFVHKTIEVTREMNQGTYVANVLLNRYAICRSDDWMAKNTPKRYTN